MKKIELIVRAATHLNIGATLARVDWIAARPDSLPHRPARVADFAGEVPAWVRERAALDAPGRWSDSVSGRIVLHDR